MIGEIGLHRYDIVSWFLNARPKAVTGFGGILHWTDGRDVPDTVQAVFEFPSGTNFLYDATLANSFDSEYEMFYGSDSAIMLRENKAWMFKEVDAPLLGWEVYARKDTFYKETGVDPLLGCHPAHGRAKNISVAVTRIEDQPCRHRLVQRDSLAVPELGDLSMGICQIAVVVDEHVRKRI